MNLIKLERGSIGNTPCPVCKTMHPAANKCEWSILARRIALLEEANKTIPEILRANAAAVDTAKAFQSLLVQADQAQTILGVVMARHGDIGKQIHEEYLKEIDTWALETSNQNIEQQKLGTEQSTLNETKDKNSIEGMKSGESSLLDF